MFICHQNLKYISFVFGKSNQKINKVKDHRFHSNVLNFIEYIKIFIYISDYTGRFLGRFLQVDYPIELKWFAGKTRTKHLMI